jgi:hypothetical protein
MVTLDAENVMSVIQQVASAGVPGATLDHVSKSLHRFLHRFPLLTPFVIPSLFTDALFAQTRRFF